MLHYGAIQQDYLGVLLAGNPMQKFYTCAAVEDASLTNEFTFFDRTNFGNFNVTILENDFNSVANFNTGRFNVAHDRRNFTQRVHPS